MPFERRTRSIPCIDWSGRAARHAETRVRRRPPCRGRGPVPEPDGGPRSGSALGADQLTGSSSAGSRRRWSPRSGPGPRCRSARGLQRPAGSDVGQGVRTVAVLARPPVLVAPPLESQISIRVPLPVRPPGSSSTARWRCSSRAWNRRCSDSPPLLIRGGAIGIPDLQGCAVGRLPAGTSSDPARSDIAQRIHRARDDAPRVARAAGPARTGPRRRPASCCRCCRTAAGSRPSATSRCPGCPTR